MENDLSNRWRRRRTAQPFSESFQRRWRADAGFRQRQLLYALPILLSAALYLGIARWQGKHPLPTTAPSVSAVVGMGRIPLSEEILLQTADAFFAQKRWKEAKRAYLAALAREPRSARALEGVGLTLNAQGNPEEAFYFLDTATHLDPGLHRAQALLAEWYQEATFTKEAVRRLEPAVQAAPENAAYWHQLGNAYGALGVQNADAEQALRRAAALDPKQPLYLLDLADMLVVNSKTAEAEAAYRQALALAPHDADALSRLGGFLLDQPPTPARSQEAERLLRQAIARNKESDFALYQLGRLALERGDSRQAIRYLQRAIRLVPQIPEMWYALSRSYARAGDTAHTQEAMRQFQALRNLYLERTHTSEQVNLRPGDPNLRLKLARLYAQNGENAKAISQYTRCLHLDPKNETARRELRDLKARLKAGGHLPLMTLFNAMAASVSSPPQSAAH